VNPEGWRRTTNGDDIVRFKPQYLRLVNVDPTIRVSFEQVGCIIFCEKLQGYNMQVAKEFALRFNGIKDKVGNIQF
jgi:ATP-dependent RNA circularization protein (DNA/RNA ligase family)